MGNGPIGDNVGDRPCGEPEGGCKGELSRGIIIDSARVRRRAMRGTDERRDGENGRGKETTKSVINRTCETFCNWLRHFAIGARTKHASFQDSDHNARGSQE